MHSASVSSVSPYQQAEAFAPLLWVGSQSEERATPFSPGILRTISLYFMPFQWLESSTAITLELTPHLFHHQVRSWFCAIIKLDVTKLQVMFMPSRRDKYHFSSVFLSCEFISEKGFWHFYTMQIFYFFFNSRKCYWSRFIPVNQLIRKHAFGLTPSSNTRQLKLYLKHLTSAQWGKVLFH